MIETLNRFSNTLKILVVLQNKKMLESLSNFGKTEIFTYNNFTQVLFSQLMEAFFNLLLAVLLYITIQHGVVLDEKLSDVNKMDK